MPAFMRCAYRCNKEPTVWKGDENREKLAQVNIIPRIIKYHELTSGTEGASPGHS